MLNFHDFVPHLGSVFQVMQPEPHGLKLVEAIDSSNSHQEQFSLIFTSTDSPWLPQATYTLLHSHLQDLALFLVPIGPNGKEMRYEAVFTRLPGEPKAGKHNEGDA